MSPILSKHLCQTSSPISGPGKAKRNCFWLSSSRTAKLCLLSRSNSTIRQAISSFLSRSAMAFPVLPPAGKTAVDSPPRMVIARLTFMPPPPGSLRSFWQRSFLVGTTWSTSALMSRQGLIVSVTMAVLLLMVVPLIVVIPGRKPIPAGHASVKKRAANKGWPAC
jgi:hypothetical protein